MAEVIVEPQAPVQETYTGIQGILAFLHDNLIWLIVIVVIIILGIIIYYLFARNEEKNRERDDPGYALYKNNMRSAVLGADIKRIRKHYSLKNLFLLGIPLIWNEHSAQIRDIDDKPMGWYRGHFESMDNCLNILLYKKKIFFFFEETFLIKAPLILKFGTEKKESNEKAIRDMKYINLSSLIQFWSNGDIKINCTSLEKIGTYYFCPVFVINTDVGKLDYRTLMEGAIVDTTYQTMIQRIATEGMKVMEKMPSFNPYVQFKQKSPQKTKEEVRQDDGEEQ